jgi:hypothetical protein
VGLFSTAFIQLCDALMGIIANLFGIVSAFWDSPEKIKPVHAANYGTLQK